MESTAAASPPPSAERGDDDRWLWHVLACFQAIIPGTSTREEVERHLASPRGIASAQHRYHVPGYPQVQVQVTYRLDPLGDRRKDVVTHVDPPVLVDATPALRAPF